MSLCDIFPDDPSCTAGPPDDTPVDDTPTKDPVTDGDEGEDDVEDGDGEEPVDEEGEEGEGDAEAEGKMESKASYEYTKEFFHLQHFSHLHIFEAQLSYLIGAAAVTSWTALQLFRYTARKDFWKKTKVTGKTNYNELADMVLNYGALVIMGAATVT
jgi:hypothetical protein|mmetsp:Transcript_5571/g.6718  ORF Transcript_5571/g.6718 Transcript_5571/m.6718 type:complete len:157 (+) Transcript_5571:57-527(+)